MLSPLVAEKRTRLKQRPGGPFDPSVIADRLEALRELAGVEPKDVGATLWPNQESDNAARSWWKRTTQKRTPFTLPEIDKAMEYLVPLAHKRGTIVGRVLPGYPFVDLYVSVAVERGEIPRPPPRRV